MTESIRDLLDSEGAAAEEMSNVDVPMVRNPTPARDPAQVYSLRLPVERISEIREIASEQAIAPTALMRRWVLERLDAELGRRESMETEATYTVTRDQLSHLISGFLKDEEDRRRGLRSQGHDDPQ